MFPPCRHIGANELGNLLRKIEDHIHKKAEQSALEILTDESSLEFKTVSGLVKEHIAKIG
jgi:hypothetical protein